MSHWQHIDRLSIAEAGLSPLVVLAFGVLLGHVLLWAAYVYVRYGKRQWWLRMLDFESYPRGSLWEALRVAIRRRLQSNEAPQPAPPRPRIAPVWCGAVANKLVGTGDVCDVYRTVRLRRPVALKVPRVDDCEHLLRKEHATLRAIQRHSRGTPYGDYFPRPFDLHRDRGRLASSFDWCDGFYTGEEIKQRYPAGVDPRHVAWMFNRTLEALGQAHRVGFVHGAVLPPHLLFNAEDHGLLLVDWIHSERIGAPLKVVSRAFKDWYPKPCHDRRPATSHTDIHLAAKSMIWLAGGDPRSGTLPDQVPHEMACFLTDCLSMNRRHTPSSRGDAWELHEQFRELLEDLYGPPKFCHLEMSCSDSDTFESERCASSTGTVC